MLEDCNDTDISLTIGIISDLLRHPGDMPSSVAKSTDESLQVAAIRSSNYSSLGEFKAAYLVQKRPVLCLVTKSEIPEVLKWLRECDDVALIGDPVLLTQWRLQRIAHSMSRQLDPVTQIYQRSSLMEALEELCPVASKECPVSIVIANVDHLKGINDRYGPMAGNQVLRQMGQLFQTLCQSTLVTRTRGGEFAVLVEQPIESARSIAELLLDSVVEQPWCEYPEVSASFGVASVTEPSSPTRLLTQADEALYSAKANGRSRVVCYPDIAAYSSQSGEDVEVISLENKAKVMSERVTSFVTQQSRMIMQNLRREANTDALTGLFNRRYLDRKLAEDYAYALRNNKDLSVALVDVDHFGEVNKQHGWPTGDRVLNGISQEILSCIRGSDWVGRYGGEELCVVMPGTNLANAVIACERIRVAIERAKFLNASDEPISVTLSIGVVTLDPRSDANVKAVLQRVSDKTLEAKNKGRNRIAS